MISRSLRDLWCIYRLRNQGLRLDLKGALLRPASPFYHATARSLPGFGLWSGRVLSVVVKDRGQVGFVQARCRTGVPALDLLYIAPALERRPGATWLWHHLLHELGRVGGEHGVQRLFAHLPEQSHAEVEVMRQGGFAIYGQDRLYRLISLPVGIGSSKGKLLWCPREPVDDWGLTRLYHAVTPGVVQQAESMLQDGSTAYAAWGSHRQGSYVLRGENAGDVLGYLRLTRGERGHWLKLVLHPERSNQGGMLLQQALGLMADWPRRPIYCDVRDYEGFLTDALERCGFERVMTRMLLVRHTTAAIRVKAARPLPVLEAVPERAATPF